MHDSPSGLRWQPVSARESIPAIVALYAEALAVDGGQPYAGDEALLRRWYTGGIEASLAAFDGGRLVGVCARRHASTGDGPRSVIAGQVAPGYRGRRDWGTAAGCRAGRRGSRHRRAGGERVADRLRRCALPQPRPASGLRRGRHDPGPGRRRARGSTAGSGGGSAAHRPAVHRMERPGGGTFLRGVHRRVGGRPGFPGWPASEWMERISGDPDFRADWTLLASVAGADAGFIAGDTGGWIAQVGVVPAARRPGNRHRADRRGARAACRKAGEARAVLDVNVNNPAAIGVYERLGFACAGRRARYEPASPVRPPAPAVRPPGPPRGRE